jgi:hypothetical protein
METYRGYRREAAERLLAARERLLAQGVDLKTVKGALLLDLEAAGPAPRR